MLGILNALFGLALFVLLPVYVMYFAALHHFGKSLQAKHPDMYAQLAVGNMNRLSNNYSAFEKLRADKALAAKLEPSVARELRDTYRYLVVGAACFMVMLFAGLGSSLIAKA